MGIEQILISPVSLYKYIVKLLIKPNIHELYLQSYFYSSKWIKNVEEHLLFVETRAQKRTLIFHILFSMFLVGGLSFAYAMTSTLKIE